MTISTLFMQKADPGDPAIQYSARSFRQLTEGVFSEGVLMSSGNELAVTERGAGANFSVDVAAGSAVIVGDDEANQGSYLAESDAVVNVAIGAPPGAGTRIDLVVMKVNDPQAGGDSGSATVITVVAGTVGAGVPALPDSAIPLASVSVTSGQTSVLNSHVTSLRTAAHAAAAEKPGVVKQFAGSTVPAGYLLCDGSTVSRTTFSALFAAIGTTWGNGDGSTTFTLPNLKGRVLAGRDAAQTEFDTLGETGGAKTKTLATTELPPHGHAAGTLSAETTGSGHVHALSTNAVTASGPNNGVVSHGSGSTTGYMVNDGEHTHTVTGSTADTGGGAAFSILPPYAVINHIIKT